MTRLETLQAGLKNIADCAIITDEVGRRYFTGMRSSAGTVLVFPEESFLIIDFRYIEKARNTVKNCEVILEASDGSAKGKRVCQHVPHLRKNQKSEECFSKKTVKNL